MAVVSIAGMAACQPGSSTFDPYRDGPSQSQMLDVANAHWVYNGHSGGYCHSPGRVYWSGHDWSMSVTCAYKGFSGMSYTSGHVYMNWQTTWIDLKSLR